MSNITHQDMREQNIKKIFKEISANNGITRNEIAPRAGVSLMTVTTIVDALIKKRVVLEHTDKTSNNRYGRRPAKIFLNADEKKIIILDLTEREFCFVLLNLGLQAQNTFKHKYDYNIGYEENLDLFLNNVKGITINSSNQENEYIGVGIISPAPCIDESEYVYCPRLPELKNINIRHIVKKYFDLEILIGEDVQLAMLSILDMMPEISDRDVFFIYIGNNGVGGAVWINGNVYFGCDGYAGDIGQLSTPDGDRIENTIAFSTFEREAAQYLKKEEAVCPRIKDNSREIVSLIYEYAGRIASTIYVAVCLFSPYAVIIESPYRMFGQEFLDIISSAISDKLVPGSRYKPLIRFSNQELPHAAYGIGLNIREKWLVS
jgi:predicted NBD/HSP70 family sugar kinase